MAYQYIDTLSIPNEREIDAINELLNELHDYVVAGQLWQFSSLEHAAAYAFEILGHPVPSPYDEDEEEES